VNIANQLTIFRVILIPFFVFFLLTDINMGEWHVYGVDIKVSVFVALLIFIVASATDWFDGYLARKYNWVTDFGKFADPLADKILVMCAMLGMVQLQWMPAWAVMIILTREFAVTGLRLLISSDGEVMAAKQLGKIKTLIQMVTLILYFIIPHSIVSSSFLYGTVFITVYSGWDYFKSYIHLLNPNK